MRRTLEVLCMVFFVCTLRSVQAVSAAPEQAPIPPKSIEVRLNAYFRELRTVDLEIDGTTRRLLLDTAGGRTLISPMLAKELGCSPRGHDVGYRMTGEPIVFQNCDRLRANLSGYSFELAPVGVFDLNRLLPPELPSLDGALALDAFRGQIIVLDWAHNRLTIQNRNDGPRALRLYGVPLRIATGENGSALAALAAGTISNKRYWFLIDSGDLKGTLLSAALMETDRLSVNGNSEIPLQIGSRPSESIVVIPDNINYDAVLGTRYLLSHVIALDLRRAP